MMVNETHASKIQKSVYTPLNCFDLISRATDMYADKDSYAYFYGAKGCVLTAAAMRALMAAEPVYFSRYSDDEIKEIFDFSIGKIGIDCSGFINQLTGVSNWSTGYINESLNQTTPAAGTWGNILYTTFGGTGRHVGIDIGQGRFLHCPKELHTIEMGLISEYPWERSGQIYGVSYFLTGNK